MREDHVKLMVNGVTKTPVQKKSEANCNGEGNVTQSLVLLHYLDTRISDRIGSNSLILQAAECPPPFPNDYDKPRISAIDGVVLWNL